MNWYEVAEIGSIDSPALLLYKDRIHSNIRKAVTLAGGAANLRPHVKTNKIAEVCRMMMEAGIHQFKCATIAEAEMLAMINAPDVLLAHQPVGPRMARLLALVQQYPQTRFSCIVDTVSVARDLSAVFVAGEATLSLFIDVNNGMKRSGIPPSEVVSLYKACIALPNLEVVGLHAYDGHVKESDLTTRKASSDKAFAIIEQLLEELAHLSATRLQVVTGGSPSFPTHTHRGGVQYSPGTFVFWDWGYHQQLPDAPFEYAALVITRVISVLDDHTICVDLGHKAVAAENPLPRVCFLNAEGIEQIGHSEEHLVLKVKQPRQYQPGDVLYGVPYHICPTVGLYDEALVVESNHLTDRWRVTGRTRKISI